MPDVPHSSLTGDALHLAKVQVGASVPTGNVAADFDGQTYAQHRSDRTTLWVAQSAAWFSLGGTPIFGSTTPGGVLTPDYRGQLYYGTATDVLYMAIGTTSADWVVIATVSPAPTGGS